jgi:hypothetical protein
MRARRRKRHAGMFTKANPVRRRKRRNVPVNRANPRARRRRNPPRTRAHHRRRNPPSVINALMDGAMNGAQVYIGGLATRKFAGAVTGAMSSSATTTTPSAITPIILRLGGAVVIALATSKLAPRFSDMLTAGAFSETYSAALAQTALAPYLGAMPPRRFVRSTAAKLRGHGNLAAWPMAGGRAQLTSGQNAGMRAWPRQRMPQNV